MSNILLLFTRVSLYRPRLVEAVIYSCIPVIIADDIVLASVERIWYYIPVKEVPNLDTILTLFSQWSYLKKQPA